MTKYKLQYWLYAILNKKFGSEVKFHRDSLHSTYEVNRHSFEISTNNLNIIQVKNWFFMKLKESNFCEDKDGFLCKLIDDKLFYIDLHDQDRGLDYFNRNKPVIIISIQSYSYKSKISR